MDFPVADQWIGPVLSTESIHSFGGLMFSHTLTASSSATWITANRAVYVPFTLPCPFLVRSIFLFNGATASGNIDLGVLGLDGSLIFSIGSTAQAGTNTLQIVTVTERVLSPGSYFFAAVLSTTAGTTTRHTYGNAGKQAASILAATSQFPLTNNPTFVTINDNVPVMGISSLTSY